jgi:hypothetical protein
LYDCIRDKIKNVSLEKSRQRSYEKDKTLQRSYNLITKDPLKLESAEKSGFHLYKTFRLKKQSNQEKDLLKLEK